MCFCRRLIKRSRNTKPVVLKATKSSSLCWKREERVRTVVKARNRPACIPGFIFLLIMQSTPFHHPHLACRYEFHLSSFDHRPLPTPNRFWYLVPPSVSSALCLGQRGRAAACRMGQVHGCTLHANRGRGIRRTGRERGPWENSHYFSHRRSRRERGGSWMIVHVSK